MAAVDFERHNWANERRQSQRELHRNGGGSPQLPSASSVSSASSSKFGASAGGIPHELADETAEEQRRIVREERWRREREEDARMVAKMGRELERLHAVNRELERRLFVEAPRVQAEMERMGRELSAERMVSGELRRELGMAVKRSARLAQMVERSAQIHKEQVGHYEQKLAELRDQIRQLNALLVAKTKSRSIGPTVARVGLGTCASSSVALPPRRRHSGECAEGGDDPGWSPAGPALASAGLDGQPLGIDAPHRRNRQRMGMMAGRKAAKDGGGSDAG